MEKWDIYDRNRQLKEATMFRGEKIKDGDFHQVIHVVLFNSQGQMLIQHRQPFKKGFSNLWDVTVGGSAVAGEASWMAAHRELLEEVGIDHDFSETLPNFSVTFGHGFDDFFLIIRDDIVAEKLVLQEEEVSEVKWAAKEEILEMIQAKTFIQYYPSLISMLFEMKGQLGAHEPIQSGSIA